MKRLSLCALLWLLGCTRTLAPLDKALASGVQAMQAWQRADGAIADPANPLFEVWETSLATLALVQTGARATSPAVARALTFLKQTENADGLVCANVRCRAAYCLETTATYLWLLDAVGQREAARTRLGPITALQPAQGPWAVGNPDVREEPTFPSVTAFVLSAYDTAEVPRDAAYVQATRWLVAQQNPEGHWGQAWEYYATPLYALWPAMRVLARASSDEAVGARTRSAAYLRANQKEDGSWDVADARRAKRPSAAMQTALALLALQALGRPEDSDAVDRGVAFLIAAQRPDGSWDGGDFPIANPRYVKKEHVAATALAVAALQAARAPSLKR